MIKSLLRSIIKDQLDGMSPIHLIQSRYNDIISILYSPFEFTLGQASVSKNERQLTNAQKWNSSFENNPENGRGKEKQFSYLI